MSYSIEPHPDHARLFQLRLDGESLRRFLAAAADLTEQRLTYVPYLRLVAADYLQQAVGGDFADRINQIVRDRRSGGFTLSVEGQLNGLDQQVALGTAVAHLLGLPNFDDMTGNYYACFTVQDSYESDSYLRQAYRAFWKRDLVSAQKLFRHAAARGSFGLHDLRHVATALLPLPLYRGLTQLVDKIPA